MARWLLPDLRRLSSQQIRISIVALASSVGLLLFIYSLNSWNASDAGLAFTSSGHSRQGSAYSLQPIQNKTLGFGRILAINLPERTDHRDSLTLAAAVSNLNIEFVNGIHGDTVLDKVLPAKHPEHVDAARLGSWRAHMNAIRSVVANDWGSALILEDDVDWDVRLKSLLADFALASSNILSGHDSAKLGFSELTPPSNRMSSPYGHGWDVLWLGHCGMKINDSNSMVVHEKDVSVPEVHYLHSWDKDEISPLSKYPPHTRIVSEQHEGVCSLAYAVSQQGARKLLNSLGLKRMNDAFDLMLREFCEGRYETQAHRCISVLPQLFDHHRKVGPSAVDSDISTSNGGYRTQALTQNIRWSVRMNMDKLVNGETDYIDQWPDS